MQNVRRRVIIFTLLLVVVASALVLGFNSIVPTAQELPDYVETSCDTANYKESTSHVYEPSSPWVECRPGASSPGPGPWCAPVIVSQPGYPDFMNADCTSDKEIRLLTDPRPLDEPYYKCGFITIKGDGTAEPAYKVGEPYYWHCRMIVYVPFCTGNPDFPQCGGTGKSPQMNSSSNATPTPEPPAPEPSSLALQKSIPDVKATKTPLSTFTPIPSAEPTPRQVTLDSSTEELIVESEPEPTSKPNYWYWLLFAIGAATFLLAMIKLIRRRQAIDA